MTPTLSANSPDDPCNGVPCDECHIGGCKVYDELSDYQRAIAEGM